MGFVWKPISIMKIVPIFNDIFIIRMIYFQMSPPIFFLLSDLLQKHFFRIIKMVINFSERDLNAGKLEE